MEQHRTVFREVKRAASPGCPERDSVCGWAAATGKYARSGSRLRSRADALLDRIQKLPDGYTDE
jgi:hypothetical protein